MVVPELDKSSEKISGMFNRIAHRYDFLNRVLSLNQDQAWRKKMVKLANLSPGAKVCDLACGTGDLTFALAEALSSGKVFGIDFSLEMIKQANLKLKQKEFKTFVKFQWGDMLDLPFDNDSFDLVTVAFGIRNVPNVSKALQEIYRILKKGGKLMILEFSKPPSQHVRPFYDFYRNQVLPRVAKIFVQKEYTAYEYLNRSIQAFYTAEDLKNLIEQNGFHEVKFKHLTMGVVAIHQGIK